MMSELNNRIEELRRQGLEKVRTEEFDDAIALYDEALALAIDDEETHELVTINKANALIAAERSGPEVKALPMILMRRRNSQHTFLAAYALMYTHRLANETKRAIFYGQIALEAATQADQSYWKLGALNELGIVYEVDSRFPDAIECFKQALALIDTLDGVEKSFSRSAIVTNLGYNELLVGETNEGLDHLHSAIDEICAAHAKSDAYIELCFGYGNLEQYETARHYGELGLELACEPRQVRNAHYLLGEAAYKMGDIDAAEQHFEELARFYPQFRHLKSLLFAIDLRSMLNLKL